MEVKELAPRGYYIQPTVFSNVEDNMLMFRQVLVFANCDISFYIIIYYAYTSQLVIIYGSIITILRKLMYKQVLCPREWIGKQIFFGYIMFKLWWIEPSSFLYSQHRVLFFVY